jgi:hypothetical protein
MRWKMSREVWFGVFMGGWVLILNGAWGTGSAGARVKPFN